MDKEFARGVIMKSRQFWIASEFGDKFKTEWPKSGRDILALDGI